jgi:hypothetical protein
MANWQLGKVGYIVVLGYVLMTGPYESTHLADVRTYMHEPLAGCSRGTSRLRNILRATSKSSRPVTLQIDVH